MQEVVEATTYTSEDVHGGNEATKDIEGSPNAADDGCNDNSDSNSSSSSSSSSDSNPDSNPDSDSNSGSSSSSSSDSSSDSSPSSNSSPDSSSDSSSDLNPDSSPDSKLNSKPRDIKRDLLDLRDSNNFKDRYSQEEIAEKIVAIIHQILKKTQGRKISQGTQRYNLNKIAKDLVLQQEYKIPHRKYSRDQVKIVNFFIDSSNSMRYYRKGIIEAVRCIEKAGYVVYLYDAGNGLYSEDAENDGYFAKEKMLSFECGIVPKYCRICIETAIQIVNASELTIILADFDGLSSLLKLHRNVIKQRFLTS